MAEPAPPESGPAPPAGALIDALRARGAARVDPVQLHFLEALARRAEAHDGRTRRLLDDRLARAAQEFGTHLDAANHPAPAVATSRGSPLAELLAHIGRHSLAGTAGSAAGQSAGAGTELKSLVVFRDSWSRLRVDRQLSAALAQAPENAGPLNSHLLALQAMQAMRELSPAYLARFLSHADALLWLDQADVAGKAAPRSAARGEQDRKRKPGRGKAG